MNGDPLIMLGKIKVWIVAGLGVLAAIFYALFQREKAQRADEHAQIAEHSAKVTKDATDAMVDGLAKEDKIRNENTPSQPRDHFN